jgi:lactate 2-monooxygenase
LPAFEPPFASYQGEIFLRGMVGEAPQHPISLAALAAQVEQSADPKAAAYVFGGAGTEDTMRANEAAFRGWRIVPRMLRDVSVRDLSVTVLGTEMPAPLGLAPIGTQTIVHPEGELAVARAAGAVGLPMTVSTVSGSTLEEIAAAGSGPKWFQLYWPTDRELAASLLSRAEQAGYLAIVVTVDTFLPGWKPRDLQGAWQPFFYGDGLANYFTDPVFRARLAKPPEEDMQAAVGEFVAQFSNPRLSWPDLEFLRSRTTLPIALKGILHPDDARAGREHGIDGVVVSNHGGRQVDGAIASLDALPAIVDAVGGELEILLDSGVRSGADVVKALALGADAVLLGRPYLWGLAADGEAGVLGVLRTILAELDLTIGLTGHTKPADLGPGLLVRAA